MVWGLVCIAAGVYILLAAIRNWDWWFESFKTKDLDERFGRMPVRIFYGVIGIWAAVYGVYILLNPSSFHR